MILYSIHFFFVCYTFFLFARVIGSWFSSFRYHPITWFVAYYSDLYLNVFRQISPPIGGTLDLSPLLVLLFFVFGVFCFGVFSMNGVMDTFSLGSLVLPSNVFYAPLSGYTNLPYRRIWLLFVRG